MYHKVIARHIVNHVIPTKHNGFIPHLLKERAMWAILGVGVGLFGFSQLLHTTDYLNIAAEVYPTTIVTLTNQDRAANNMPALAVSQTLVEAAKLKAADMVAGGYFAHTSPSGVTPWHWFAEANYTFMYAGENLAINFNDSGDVEKAWLNSPAHRANVLSPNFTEMGVATADGVYEGKETTYVVELFGMPAVAVLPAPKPVTAQPTKTAALQPEQKATQPKASQPRAEVAGEAVTAKPQPITAKQPLVITKQSPTFVAVQNTDPAIKQISTLLASVPTAAAPLPWYDRIVLNADTYIALIIQIIIIALILAMTGLVMREYEKHHLKHMTYGVLMTVILTSFLFVGRIGVFAENTPSFDEATQTQ